MKKSALYSLAALGLGISAGCAMIGQGGEEPGSFPAAYSLDGKPLAPRKPGVKPGSCAAGGDARTCTIPVKVNNPSCDPSTIEVEEYVKLPPISEKNRVIWKLPAGYVFCQRAGDGVFMKNPNIPDNFFEPVHNPKCSDEFEWKRRDRFGREFEYFLRFRSSTRNCIKDPWMSD
jgi:hypothetical protein